MKQSARFVASIASGILALGLCGSAFGQATTQPADKPHDKAQDKDHKTKTDKKHEATGEKKHEGATIGAADLVDGAIKLSLGKKKHALLRVD